MYDSYNYPAGADTPDAPWNEPDELGRCIVCRVVEVADDLEELSDDLDTTIDSDDPGDIFRGQETEVRSGICSGCHGKGYRRDPDDTASAATEWHDRAIPGANPVHQLRAEYRVEARTARHALEFFDECAAEHDPETAAMVFRMYLAETLAMLERGVKDWSEADADADAILAEPESDDEPADYDGLDALGCLERDAARRADEADDARIDPAGYEYDDRR